MNFLLSVDTSFALLFIIISLSCFLSGWKIDCGPLRKGNDNKKTSKVPNNNPQQPKIADKPRYETEIEKSLSVKPVNAKTFEYEYCKGGIDDSYNYYEMLKGIHSFSTNDHGGFMSIISEDDINQNGTEGHKSALRFTKRMLDGKLNILYEEYNSKNSSYDFNSLMSEIFYPMQAGFAADMSGLIDNISYPGMDQTVALYTIDGQNPPAGDISIIVLARKGKNYIMLKSSSSMKTSNVDGTKKPLFKKCVDNHGYTDETRQCYVKALNNSKDIQDTLAKKAKELVKLFAIK